MVKSFLQTTFVVIVGLSILGIAGRYAQKAVAPGTTGDQAKFIAEAQENAYQWGEEQLEFQKQEYEQRLADRDAVIAERDARIAELEAELAECRSH